MSEFQHIPVLVSEVLEHLQVAKNKNFIDGTVGGGGHAAAILAATGPHGKVLGLDLDPEAIKASEIKLKKYGARAILRRVNYKQINKIKTDVSSVSPVSGILLDLGLSSDQLDRQGRGFSFNDPAPLDMRFDPVDGQTAVAFIQQSTEEQLAHVIHQYGEERQAKKIAHLIKALADQWGEALTADVLANAIEEVEPRRGRRIHPATKTFQALRMAINDELGNIQSFLDTMLDWLPSGARIVIISFHSLEDRLVKQFFKQQARTCICPPELPICRCNHQPRLKILTKHVVTASEAELKANPRSRSAVLRAAEVI